MMFLKYVKQSEKKVFNHSQKIVNDKFPANISLFFITKGYKNIDKNNKL